jgi:hypothetical protein
MSLRKIVGLLAGFALAVGLIGAGVSAQFTDQVKAIQNIQVGTFGCAISSTSTDASLGNYVKGYAHSVSYTTNVTSSTGTAPFNFKVTSTGTIPVQVTVAQPALPTLWSSLLTDPGPQDLTAAGNAGDSYTYNAGVAWAGLGNDYIGWSGSFTWTVNCGELPARTPPTIAVVCPQVQDVGNGSTNFNWYVSLHGVEPNYNMDWSTNGADWNGPNDWSDLNDPLAGGGWGGPITTTSFADNGGDNLWVRWSSDPGSKVGPVSNVCPI